MPLNQDAGAGEVGLSLRLIRMYDPADDVWPRATTSLVDMALSLALSDEREVPASQKVADALAYLKSRIH